MNLEREILIDHYKNPRNYGKIENSINLENKNISCGDEIEIFLKIKDNKIEDVKHITNGCTMCTASMSIFSSKIKNKDINELEKIDEDEFFDIVGIQPTLSRFKCVTLPLESVKKAIKKYKEDENENNS